MSRKQLVLLVLKQNGVQREYLTRDVHRKLMDTLIVRSSKNIRRPSLSPSKALKMYRTLGNP